MIVEMKKISLLCVASDADASLEELRNIGVLHLGHVNEPKGEDLESNRRQLERARTALNLLDVAVKNSRRKAAKGSQHKAQAVAGTLDSAAADIPHIIDRIHSLSALAREFSERIDALNEEKSVIEPYGHYDPEVIDDLGRRGLTVRLYQVGARHTPQPPADTWVFPLAQDAAGQYFAVVGLHDFVCEEACEHVPHHRSLAMVEHNLKEALTDIEHTNRELLALAVYRPALLELIGALESRTVFLEARAGMGDGGKVVYLQGFCPVDLVETLRAAARKHGWGLVIDNPSEEESVPTLIRSPAWVRPAKALFDFLGIVPGYRETDVRPAFLIFLSIFFAIIVGDAGYGILLLMLTLWLRKKMPRAPAEPFSLMTIFFSATIVWGVITANYFGLPVDKLPPFLRTLHIAWLSEQDNSMSFCLMLGAVHLTVAHLWNAIRVINSPKAISQIGWIGITWTMFMTARTLLLGAPLPSWFAVVPAAGTAAIVTGVVLEKAWMNLAMLPQDFVNSFGDLMSYLRLFALGIAGMKVAGAFNEMAGMIGFSGIPAILGASAALLIGHVLNIILCALSVLVHGVRLNALEFSLHMGQEWSGNAYVPFAHSDAEAES